MARQKCDVLFMVTNFHSVVLEAADLDSAAADYARLLGHAPGLLEIDRNSGRRSVVFSLSNMLLEIREFSDGEEAAEKDRKPGLVGFRLGCDDVAEVVLRLKSANYAVLRGRTFERGEKGGSASRHWVSTCIDPNASRAIKIELISEEMGARPEPEATGLKPGSVIRGLDHVVLMSPDIEASRDFYAEGLGVRLALDRSFPKRGVRLIFFRIGGVTIELAGSLKTEKDSGGRDRFGGLAWQVGELDEIHSRLSADRFDVSGIRDGNKPGTRVCTVRDPVHGVPTLLIEPVS